MTVEEMVKKALIFECDEVFAELEKIKPRDLADFYYALDEELYKNASSNDETDLFAEWEKNLPPNQYKKWVWLNSTEREREYLLSIPEDQMTDQDWFDLRACDF